jgi:hypothetical protein
MPEVWLRQNVRAVLFVGACLALLAAQTGVMAAGLLFPVSGWFRAALILFAIVWIVLLLAVVLVGWRPRLAYSRGRLLINVRLGEPYAVPIEFVEGFLLGQSPAQVRGDARQRTEARSLNIKLADRAAEWQQQGTLSAWGKWCDGYITICGTWCEPLSLQVVERLNRRLNEAHKSQSQTTVPTTAVRELA